MNRKTLKDRSERAARRDEIYVFAADGYATKVTEIAAKLWREGYQLGRREALALIGDLPQSKGSG